MNSWEIFSILSRIGFTISGNSSLSSFTFATRTFVLLGTFVLVRRMSSGGSGAIRLKVVSTRRVNVTAPPKQLVVLSSPDGLPWITVSAAIYPLESRK